LDIAYDLAAIGEVLNPTILSQRRPGVWKYRELLPINDPGNIVSLCEGGTPLLHTRRVGGKLGLDELWVIDEGRNPTGSFKDRPMTVGVSKAVEFGYETVASASSGNAAAALSAYAAKADLKCITFVQEMTSAAKLVQLAMHDAKVVRVRGLESGQDPAVKMLKESCGSYDWYPCPTIASMNPYQAEGPKTMSYEIVEALEWKTPDWVVVPVGGGGALSGNWKGYTEFSELGFIDDLPRMVAVQPSGCAPLVRAFENGVDADKIVPWARPDSVAKGLLDPFPWDGDAALKAVRDSKGTAVAVLDEDILSAQKLLAKYEGIFAEPSGTASLAGLIKLKDSGKIDRSDKVVVEVTGSGLKDTSIMARHVAEPPLINPSIEELKRVLKNW
jgi:threonine synthase